MMGQTWPPDGDVEPPPAPVWTLALAGLLVAVAIALVVTR